jgi:hypothetical protein
MISIAAAPGWAARFLDDAEPDGMRTVTLAAWALVESDDAQTELIGLVQRGKTDEAPVGRLALADEVPGFDGYTITGLKTKTA